LGLENAHYSPGLEKDMVWLSGTEKSFEHAKRVIQRIGHITISDSSIWRRKEKWGARFLQREEEQCMRANTVGSAEVFRARVLGSQKRVAVSMDGTMVRVRKEGWKELKVGCLCELRVYPTRDPVTGDWEDLAHGEHLRYTAHLGGPEAFGQQLWALAKAYGWEVARDRQAIGDGAPWIWNQVMDHFYDAEQTVDWYHATEHLTHIALLLHGEGTPAYTRWYNTTCTALYQGHAADVAQEVLLAAEHYPEGAAQELRREADYLQTHQRRMQYQQVRENGYLLGSGMVECGGKQFKARFYGPGMRWNRTGLERLIPIRAAVLDGSFESEWEAVHKSPLN
jgi:hypothetical protein